MGCDLTDDNAPEEPVKPSYHCLAFFKWWKEPCFSFNDRKEVGKKSFFPFWTLGNVFSEVVCFYERGYCLLNTRVVAVNVWRVKGLKGREQKTFRVLSVQKSLHKNRVCLKNWHQRSSSWQKCCGDRKIKKKLSVRMNELVFWSYIYLNITIVFIYYCYILLY